MCSELTVEKGEGDWERGGRGNGVLRATTDYARHRYAHGETSDRRVGMSIRNTWLEGFRMRACLWTGRWIGSRHGGHSSRCSGAMARLHLQPARVIPTGKPCTHVLSMHTATHSYKVSPCDCLVRLHGGAGRRGSGEDRDGSGAVSGAD